MGMKLYTTDKNELMDITEIKREGQNVVLAGKIMKSLPMTAVITPAEARHAFRLLDLRTTLFILTLPFRNWASKGP
jgi:hypothetical protein